VSSGASYTCAESSGTTYGCAVSSGTTYGLYCIIGIDTREIAFMINTASHIEHTA